MHTGNNILKNQLASQLLETGFATIHACLDNRLYAARQPCNMRALYTISK